MAPIPDDISADDRQLIQELLDQKPSEFTDLTQTQYEAFQAGVLESGNHLLIAETGNGKTFVAEALTKKALNNGETVAYLVPSLALVAEKHETLSEWAPEDKLLTQGYNYSEADVVVATFESFFEAVVRGYASRFDTVILDDFHEIYSSHRGPNIEKGIAAALDQDMELLAVSATVGNPHTVARWMDAKLIISSEERAVPIDERPVEKTDTDYASQIASIIRQNRDNGPFLVFNDTTAHAESRAQGLAEQLSFQSKDDINFRAEVEDAISTELTDSHRDLIRLLDNGIAYHHAQMEDGLKDLIEAYTEDGTVKCVFCTTTLSYGFDSPVQSVIVADLKRWESGRGRHFIGVYEYVQWIGRAGRDADKYDEAYAFPLYDDENASDRFQFDISVEDKDLEDIDSHLSGQTALRWLVLELIAYGWETKREVLSFIQSTLFWSETVSQIPQHMQDDLDVQPASEIEDEVDATLSWLLEHGLIHRPVGQPQKDERYTATEIGSSIVEYEHSNWFDDRVSDVLNLADYLDEQGDDITPELLVQRLAGQYYHCDTGLLVDGIPSIQEKLHLHELSGTEGVTAALICWYWCSGIPMSETASHLGVDTDEISSLPSTADSLSTALASVRLLYGPIQMPDEPEWLNLFADQVGQGIPGPDMYLVQNADHFGRVRYNSIQRSLNNLGDASWDPGSGHYLIERLSALLADATTDQFRDMLSSMNKIGPTVSENIYEAVESWNPDDATKTEVPFGESLRDRDADNDLVQYHDSSNLADESRSTESETSVTSRQGRLDDF